MVLLAVETMGNLVFDRLSVVDHDTVSFLTRKVREECYEKSIYI